MKYGRHIGAFILFLFTIITALAQDEGKEDAVPYKELKKHIPAECKGLHRVKDMDDLLLQMYYNIDTHCLFNIKTDDLQQLWGLPVINMITKGLPSGERGKVIHNYEKLRKHHPGLFIAKDEYSFKGKHNTQLFVSSGESFDKTNCGYGGSISRGIFPKILPNPVSGPGISIFETDPILIKDGKSHCILSDSLYIPYNNYY